jgi:Ca2+-transporting ATPase
MSELAGVGLRVLAVASAEGQQKVPESLAEFSLTWCGLVAFADPLRASVPMAVEECHTAGIRVVMITGDYPLTARSIAKEAGIPAEQVRTGEQLASWDEATLQREIASTQVFARVAPREKLRLVEALKRAGEVVAMTGDGVNDAPALKAAHIGIAMGERGTQVAREAASLILLDDAFESIVAAVRQGRRIYGNIVKASRFILAVHVPIAGLSILPVLMGDWPLMLLPVHIAFLEFIIDPACALIFEAERADRDDMRHPPRPVKERLFSRPTVIIGVLQGMALGCACAAIFAISWQVVGAEQARTLGFIALVVGVLMLILINRSETQSAWSKLREKNLALLGVAVMSLAFLTLSVSVEPVRELFSFAPVSLVQVLIVTLASVCSLLWFECFKAWRTHCQKAA